MTTPHADRDRSEPYWPPAAPAVYDKPDTRTDRYADAIYDLAVDHAMWIGDDGKPLDYLRERETRLADFIYQAAAAVAAVADAEQADLRAEVKQLRVDGDDQ